jgi:hypothetical protein
MDQKIFAQKIPKNYVGLIFANFEFEWKVVGQLIAVVINRP